MTAAINAAIPDLPSDMPLAKPVETLTGALTAEQVQAVAVVNPRRLFGLG